MHVYLTKVHGGRYLLTRLKPIIRTIRGTETLDAFSQPGEPLDVRHLCEPGIVALLGHSLEPLVPTKIELAAIECNAVDTIKVCVNGSGCSCRQTIVETLSAS